MKEAAIQILIFNPNNFLPEAQRGVVVNPRLKDRFKQFVPIGVYKDGEDLKYYFFDHCDNSPKTYNSLDELKKDLPKGLENLFENNPKLFVIGHGNGGYYGLGNCHGESEHLYDEKFDDLLDGFKKALPKEHGDIFVTLEGCNTDSQLDAIANQQEKTFLERVSDNHREITFGGTGPWDANDPQTGFRSLAPQAPITSMAGNVWKAGNSVVFFNGDTQIAVRKSLFATTQTAKELKVNTVEFARAMLGESASKESIKKIALHRDILKIEDLKKIDDFPTLNLEQESLKKFIDEELRIIGVEQANYITQARDILDRAAPIEQLTNRDLVVLLLGLKEPSVFKGYECLLDSILANKDLLQLVMVSCGKVLIGGPSNDSVIDLILKQDIDINSTDTKGRTALHYAVQNFYNYREEPLNLIKKLLSCGASVEVKDNQGCTPVDKAHEHSKDKRVTGSDKVIESLNSNTPKPTPLFVKQSIRKLFQMSQHKADELLSLPIQKREYSKCNEGTLYIPEKAAEKLHSILLSTKKSDELLSVFEKELNAVTNELEKGKGTGEVFDDEDELIAKCFDNAKEQIQPVMDELVDMKKEIIKNTTKLYCQSKKGYLL
jgi:Ankyrin repeat